MSRQSAPGPTFSVIVPVFNGDTTIAAALRSVQHQTRRDFEIVVADDGSSDSTVSIVESFMEDERIRLLRRPHLGPASARNAALSDARGAFVSLLDADDLYLPDYLASMHAALTANERAAIAVTDAWLFDDRFRRVRRRTALSSSPHLPSDPGELFALLLEDNHVFGLVMMRRSLVDTIGSFDERLAITEDYEYWLRAASFGELITRVPGIHAVYRLSPTSLSGPVIPRLEARVRAYGIVEREYGHLPLALRERAGARRLATERELQELRGRSPVQIIRRVRLRARSSAKRLLPWRRGWLPAVPPDVDAAVRLGRS